MGVCRCRAPAQKFGANKLLEQNFEEGDTLAHKAVAQGKNPAMSLMELKQAGVDLSALNYNEMSPLHLAAQIGKHENVVTILFFEAPSKSAEVDLMGENFLHKAARNGKLHLGLFKKTRRPSSAAANDTGTRH